MKTSPDPGTSDPGTADSGTADGGTADGGTAGRTATPARGARLAPDVFAELYRAHAPALLGALLKLTHGDRGRAEDVMQETFVRAWTHPEAIRSVAQGRPRLFTVARRIVIDQYRAQACRVQEVPGETHEEQAPAVAADPYDAVLLAHDVEGALARLRPHHRQVLVEVHLRGRSFADAAQVLGVPVGTVKSRAHHAARALRPVLADRGLSRAG
ncbi:sigma-70 family RNA polymerase sigma factor [Streptomyces sp. NPDC090025]|uniref:sigma-70 family RNA polymerase sigma factor n=1 Tax=Streptomyces sp. NPDC090025 TaxID=3365922 RepID=UPI0038386C37